ncbi:hypothetical protein SNE40_018492 [Patella caerulea]|uniref:Uncharacterized protein n=1 Tax=Patella caerulea TaxID=87958 RepID=A0AAN8PC23_PATCE
MFKCITRQDSIAVSEGMKKGMAKKKITIVGDGESGKTSLINRFAHGGFNDDNYLPTVTEITVENVEYGQKAVELNIQDTAGQESYGTLRPISYPGTDVIVVCFSIDNIASLENVSLNWVPEIRHFCGAVTIVLVGTKSDVRDTLMCGSNSNFLKHGPLKYEDGCAMAYRINAVTYLECSSKSDKGIEEVFHAAIKASLSKPKKKRLF